MKYLKKIVIPRVAAKWKTVAYFLDYDIHVIDTIANKYRDDPMEYCDGLFRDWLTTNHGKTPKTWATLLTCLKEIDEMATVASDIQKELKELWDQ